MQPIDALASPEPRFRPKTERLTAQEALGQAVVFFCEMTGSEPCNVLKICREGHRDVARGLACWLLLDQAGYGPTEIARAFPINPKTGKKPHYSSPRYNQLKAWSILNELPEHDVQAFTEWCVAHWREPVESNRQALRAKREAFQQAVEEIRAKNKTNRVGDADKVSAIHAMMQAQDLPENVVKLKTKRAPRAVSPQEPEPVQFLRLTPLFQKHAKDLRSEYVSGGCLRINAWALTAKLAQSLLNSAVNMLDLGQWKAMQAKPVAGGDGRWNFCLEVAPLAMAFFIALSPLFPWQGQRTEIAESV